MEHEHAEVVGVAEGVVVHHSELSESWHGRDGHARSRDSAVREPDCKAGQGIAGCQALVKSLEGFAVELPGERLEFKHLVYYCSQEDVEHHAVVRYPTLREVFDTYFAPLAPYSKVVHECCMALSHQAIERHGEGAATAIAFWPAANIAYFWVAVQADLSVQLRQCHVVKQPACPAYSCYVANIVQIADYERDEVERQADANLVALGMACGDRRRELDEARYFFELVAWRIAVLGCGGSIIRGAHSGRVRSRPEKTRCRLLRAQIADLLRVIWVSRQNAWLQGVTSLLSTHTN